MFDATDTVELFPSYLWLHKVSNSEALNRDLMQALKDMKEAGEGWAPEGGGWASPTDLFEREAFLPLSEYVVEAVGGVLQFLRYKYEHFYISECWANWNDGPVSILAGAQCGEKPGRQRASQYQLQRDAERDNRVCDRPGDDLGNGHFRSVSGGCAGNDLTMIR